MLTYLLNRLNRYGNLKALKYKSYSKIKWKLQQRFGNFLSLFCQTFGRIKFVPKVNEKFLKISFDESKLSSKTPHILSVKGYIRSSKKSPKSRNKINFRECKGERVMTLTQVQS